MDFVELLAAGAFGSVGTTVVTQIWTTWRAGKEYAQTVKLEKIRSALAEDAEFRKHKRNEILKALDLADRMFQKYEANLPPDEFKQWHESLRSIANKALGYGFDEKTRAAIHGFCNQCGFPDERKFGAQSNELRHKSEERIKDQLLYEMNRLNEVLDERLK